MEDPVEQIIQNLPAFESGKRLVVGIDGLSRSGKTTITGKLMRHFKQNGMPAACFHLDDFIVERNRRYGTGQEEWHEYYQLQWEIGWLREHFFRRLKEADRLVLPYYDGEKDERDVRETVLPASCVIIVEGVFLQRLEWRDCCDWVVYVDSLRQSRIEREAEVVQLNRKKFEDRYWPAEDYYITEVEPQRMADIIVKNH